MMEYFECASAIRQILIYVNLLLKTPVQKKNTDGPDYNLRRNIASGQRMIRRKFYATNQSLKFQNYGSKTWEVDHVWSGLFLWDFRDTEAVH